MATNAKSERPVTYDQPFHLGDRIRKARELTGQDRQTFAESIGIHRDTLAKYEETGVAKRAALISITWNTRVRLEWLETGALPWLKDDDDNGPTTPANEMKHDGDATGTARIAPVTPIRRAS